MLYFQAFQLFPSASITVASIIFPYSSTWDLTQRTSSTMAWNAWNSRNQYGWMKMLRVQYFTSQSCPYFKYSKSIRLGRDTYSCGVYSRHSLCYSSCACTSENLLWLSVLQELLLSGSYISSGKFASIQYVLRSPNVPSHS